jgi:uncharacterized 2Fe-2S/4Fe-4S cluster protein (DUF4445 family)
MKEKYKITIIQDNQDRVIDCSVGETIQEAMLRHGLTIRADCGGRGTCGKCKLKLLSGVLAVTQYDQRVFTAEELQAGCRLACKAIPTGDILVLINDSREAELKGITEFNLYSFPLSKHDRASEEYVIGIDLGTTTLAFQLANEKGTVIAAHSAINPQRGYGADVIARIKASNEGEREQLSKLIREALRKGIDFLIRKTSVNPGSITKIAIAGNTTMIHLLMGFSCEGLGVYPFTPVSLDAITVRAQELLLLDDSNSTLKPLQEAAVILLPGISTFVGGDILAGLAVCGYDTAKGPSLFIDFGTNGEIALGNKERILVSSTAAGPAFEGGNISCGVGSVPGAISHVSLWEEQPHLETIEGRSPIGICGTGIVDLAAELYRTGKMDNTGLLVEEYFQEGYPLYRQEEGDLRFTQKDVRELQLAKAAVRAGIELLLLRYGTSYEQLDRVFLAGGFGFFMDVEKAAQIGLLPVELTDKISIIGNSALAGALQYAINSDFADRMERIKVVSEEVHLAKEDDFNDRYLEYMDF